MRVQHDRADVQETILLSLGFQYEKDASGRPKKTTCRISQLAKAEDKTGTVIGEGSSICHEADQMRKAAGRKIALSRALKSAKADRQMRTSVWNEYLKNAGV